MPLLTRREAIATAASALTLRANGPKPWYLNNPRVYLLDFQIPDPKDQGAPGMPHFFAKFDAAEIAKQVADAGATALLVHTKCHEGSAYYNTRVGHKHSDLGARDFIAEFSSACRKQGLTLLFYYSVAWDRRAWNDHPEFRAIDSDGKPFVMFRRPGERPSPSFLASVCLNGPYRTYAKAMLKELTANYDFDGYWLDVVTVWNAVNPCFCAACKQSMPATSGPEYLRWRTDLNTRVLHDLSDEILRVKPGVTVSHNQSAFGRMENWNYCDRDAYVSHEYHYPEGSGGLSLTCLRNEALKPGKPFEIEIWRFSNRLSPAARYGYSREWQTRPADTLLSEMATVVAHGGFPQYYDNIRFDGTLEPRSLAAMQPAWARVREAQPWSRVGQRVRYAGIVWSKSSELYGEDGATLHPMGVRGFHQALMEQHLPTEVIGEPDLVKARLGGLKVLILPSVEVLSPQAIQSLTSFVRLEADSL